MLVINVLDPKPCLAYRKVLKTPRWAGIETSLEMTARNIAFASTVAWFLQSSTIPFIDCAA